MHEQVIRQRDIELEGKNERIRGLIAEADALRARLRKVDATAAGLQGAAGHALLPAATLAVVSLLIVALLLLLLLLLRDSWPAALSLRFGVLGEASPAHVATFQPKSAVPSSAR